LIEIIPVQQTALEGLDNSIYFPLGSVFVLEKVLYAGPTRSAVKFTALSLVKELTMLLTHIFLVFLAISNLH
jgi:hypothetical protein